MKFLTELYQLGFLNPVRPFKLYKAKKLHGKNSCFLLQCGAAFYKHKTAIADGQQSLSFAELYEEVTALSSIIHHQTEDKEDVTAVLVCNNSIQHILLLFAIQNTGMKLVLINDKNHQNDILNIINTQKNPCLVFASESKMLQVENLVCVEELFNYTEKKQIHFKPSQKATAVIFPTSGTTGASKLIEKKEGAFYWFQSFTDLVTYTGIYKMKSVFIAVPVSHGFGYTALMFSLVLGKKAVVSANKDWNQKADIILQEKVELIAGVPTSLFYLAEKLKGKNHQVGLIISGGAPLNQLTLDSITQSFGKNIFSMYGSTEASTSFVANYAQLQTNICALGKPLKTVKYKLDSINGGGNELLIQSGLTNIKSDSGWIHTGDLVMKDETGLLIWCGRKDDMIIKNGVNIYPVEIEKHLLSMAEIEEALVTKEKHPVKGEIIIAFVKFFSGVSVSVEEINTRLRQVMASIKVPDRIEIVSEFGYTPTGKRIKPVLN
ncbi:MAG: acyl--CoA ligase [Chitinophagaceae bacterium]|nr:acyl--CoA ligase [Chitinophagaceae bacterium]MBP7107978.1 acyl--CoA ligase [Chitinophagaceae bacterium]MBP7314718.1 acyl--CoA ligase [Chitinophagaceae bacterium]HRA10265.1 class I adenylate-forming enzyme family protein [Chitinophagaceae bacterium]